MNGDMTLLRRVSIDPGQLGTLRAVPMTIPYSPIVAQVRKGLSCEVGRWDGLVLGMLKRDL